MSQTNFQRLDVYKLAERLADEIWNIVIKWDALAKDTVCQLSTANCQLSTANYQLPTINCQLPTINYQLPTANYQLPTA